MEEIKFSSEDKQTYANRWAKKLSKTLAIIGFIFLLVMVAILPFTEKIQFSAGVIFSLIGYLIGYAVLVFGIAIVLYHWFKFARYDFVSNLTYFISDKSVIQKCNYDNLFITNQLAFLKNTKLYGMKVDMEIDFSILMKTTLKKNQIRFHLSQGSFIEIPKECEDFERIKQVVLDNPKKFDLRGKH